MEFGEIYFICYPLEKNKKIWKGDKILSTTGSYGTVWKVCKNKECDYVMKVVKLDAMYHSAFKEKYVPYNIKKEICFQKICAEHNLCKPVEDWWICKDGKTGVIITKFISKTLIAVIGKNNNIRYEFTLVLKALELIHELHKLGIYHGDPHLSNIMVDKDRKLYFIDMGNSGLIKNNYNTIIFDYKIFLNDFGFYDLAEDIENEKMKKSVQDSENFIYNFIVDGVKKLGRYSPFIKM